MKSYRFIPSMFLIFSLGACQAGINQSPEELGPSGGQDATETTDSTTETNTDVEEATDIAQDATTEEAPQCALEERRFERVRSLGETRSWLVGWRIHPPWCRR